MVQPVIEAADVTPTTGNSATPALNYPAHNSGDLLTQLIHIDEDLTEAGLAAPSTGPNGETLDVSSTGSGGSSTSGPTNGIIAWIASANTGAGSLSWSVVTTSEAFVGHTIIVPAGEHGGVGTLSGYAGSPGNVTDLPTPSWSIGAGEGGGTVLIGLSVDGDPISTTDPAGWTQIDNSIQGSSVSAIVAVRDAATTASETIASVNFTTASGSDSTSSIGIVILPPAAAGGAKMQSSLMMMGVGN